MILQIALAIPHTGLFDYLPCNPQQEIPQIGIRVLVPFGKQTKVGILHKIRDKTDIPKQKLKKVLAYLESQPIFSENILKLIEFASRYYLHGLGQTYFTALPTALRKPKPFQSDFNDEANLKKTLAKFFENPFMEKSIPHLSLTKAQQKAYETIINALNTFKIFFLEGITGSGKTEIYLQSVEKVVCKKKQVLILVPEIGLTPQMLKRFQQRFCFPIVYIHSKLSEKKRLYAYLLARSGLAQIIIATRLACFVPLKNPGLLIMDESHDLSFKQQEGIRYSARNLLIKRAALENCPVVLGSATPALETVYNTEQKKYQHLVLKQRPNSASLPKIICVDIRNTRPKTGLSQPLLDQIQNRLDKKEQSLIFINRRGYAPVLMCLGCQYTFSCQQCDAHFIFHATDYSIRCHHCGHKAPVPTNCLKCDGLQLQPIGLGTQKLEQKLLNLFPNVKIARIDKDVIKNEADFKKHLEEIHNKQYDILIGTQMLAKGHHFPNVSLVGILDCDSAYFSTDFRAMEYMGQLITQVAGRAGRAEKPGVVILQTTQPEHPLLKTLLHDGFTTFSKKLLVQRKQAQLPPFSYQILMRAQSKRPDQAFAFLEKIKKETKLNKLLKILGPIHSPMQKKQNYYRVQLLFQSVNRSILHNTVKELVEKLKKNNLTRQVQWSLDVDPVDMF